MKSKFIPGLLTADKKTLVNFISIWDESTISNILKYKATDLYDSLVHKQETDHLSDLIAAKKEALEKRGIEELRTIVIMQLSTYSGVRLPKTFNMYSLDKIGLKIERRTIEILQKSEKSFDGSDIDQMIAHIFKQLFDDMAKQFKDNDAETKDKIAQDILKTIEEMPQEQQDKIKEELSVDELSQEVIQKALISGTLGAAFAATISIAGFSAYTFATSALASMAGLVGLTLPFGAYTGLTSVMAVVSNPLFLIGAMGFLLYFLNSRSNESIRNRLSPIIVSLISVLSVKADDFICESSKYLQEYNSLLSTYGSVSPIEKVQIESKVIGLKGCSFEGRSVYSLASIPSSTLPTCDDSMQWVNQPIEQTTAYESLKKYFDGPIYNKHGQTDLAIASLTLGDLIYDISRVDPLLIESVDFARKDDIADMFSFAYFAERIDTDSVGDISQLKGYVAERLIAQRLQSQGYEVQFPETSNQPGYDLLINDEPFQVKCGDSPSLLNEHFEKYPDIPSLVNEELGAMFADDPMVFTIDGIRNDEITALTIDDLDSGSEILDFEIPLVTIAVVSGKNIFSVWQDRLEIEDAIGKTLAESAARMTGAFAGSNLLMLGGLIWMPAAGVVGGAVGAVLGSMSIVKLVDRLKVSRLLKEETKDIEGSVRKLMESAIRLADKNIWIAEQKFYKIRRLFENKDQKRLLQYLEYRYDQERQYRDEKIVLMHKAIHDGALVLDEETSNILIAAQNAIVLTEQVGIHPYNLQEETGEVVKAVRQFGNALSASQITEFVKKEVIGSEVVDALAQNAKKRDRRREVLAQ